MDLGWIVCLYQDVIGVTGVRKLMDKRMNGWEELEVRWKDEGVKDHCWKLRRCRTDLILEK